MFRETEDYIKCKDEQSFKMAFIRKELEAETKEHHVFCIESESTMIGFPDVMELIADSDNIAYFYEFKFADKAGNIKFQPTQPGFYRRHPNMNITVVACNPVSRTVHLFKAQGIFAPSSPYFTADNRINLCKVEADRERNV